jgi:AraC family transcriptional activator of pobA
MKQALLHFKGLYGDSESQGFSHFFHWEKLVTRSKLYNWEIEEHFHDDIHQFFFIKKGSGTVFSFKNQVNFQAPCILSIPADKVHGFKFNLDLSGEVWSFSQEYMDSRIKDIPNLNTLLDEIRIISSKQTELWESIIYSQKQFIHEWQEDFPNKALVLNTYFQLLMAYILRLNAENEGNHLQGDNRSLHYLNQFKSLIRRHSQKNYSIKEFANLMGISAIHLNRICRSTTQKSAHDIVMDHLLNDAKMHLLNPSYTISEIAYLLNFKDPAYFSRIFKKKIGVSPKEFRM